MLVVHTHYDRCLLNFVICLYRTNTNVNDALGDYSLTLVDSLDTLVVRREGREYRKGRGGRGEEGGGRGEGGVHQ